MKYRIRTALPVCRSFPQPQWALLAGLQGRDQELCPQQTELDADPHPHSLQGCTSPWVQMEVLEDGGGSAGQKAENWLKQ